MQIYYIFCDLIGDLKSEIGHAPCDKKCYSEHQTLFACVEGMGMRLWSQVHCKSRLVALTTQYVVTMVADNLRGLQLSVSSLRD